MSWITGEQIARALGGTWTRNRGLAHCPAHEDDKESLSIAESQTGKTLLYCHAGCTNQDVIAALRERGLWSGTGKPRSQIKTRHVVSFHGRASLTERALKPWRASKPVEGTDAEVYLRKRGIKLPIPSSLRYHDFA